MMSCSFLRWFCMQVLNHWLAIYVTYSRVLCRNWGLFCSVFHLHDHVWNAVLLKGRSTCTCALLIQEYLICLRSVYEPTLNEYLVMQCFKYDDATEEHNGIIFDFYVGCTSQVVLVSNPPSMYCQSFSRASPEIYRRERELVAVYSGHSSVVRVLLLSSSSSPKLPIGYVASNICLYHQKRQNTRNSLPETSPHQKKTCWSWVVCLILKAH